MDSARDNAALPALGFPIRESTGQRSFNTSPWLIAVVHALLRLLVPRHPPCALSILTVSSAAPVGAVGAITLLAFVQFSSSAEAGQAEDSARGPSKLSSDARSTFGIAP